MSRVTSFLFGAVVGGALMFGGMKYHVVRANDGIYMIPKLNTGIEQVYVDIRNFDAQDWAEHTSLAFAIMQADKGYLLQDAAEQSLQDSIRSAVDSLTNSSPSG